MQKQFYARISDSRGQLLKNHLLEVANLMNERSKEKFRIYAYYIGLWHDLGKYREEWQNYLINAIAGKNQERINHAGHGACVCEHPVINGIIAGHHSSIKPPEQIGENSMAFAKYEKEYQECIANATQEIPHFIQEIPRIKQAPNNRDAMARMLYSLLIDSDRLNAQCFATSTDWNEIIDNSGKVVININIPSHNRNTPINLLRNKFRSAALKAAKNKPGLYKLTGATGIGKTYTAFEFAALHNNFNKMNGIIYVAPFNSILDQTSSAIHEIIDNEILDHYGSFDNSDSPAMRISCSRWDKPVILTSMVQLLSSMFSDRATKVRKLQGLIDRVIIIDEPQALPIKYITPILNMLSALVEDWGCSVVFMSATQPVFNNIGTWNFQDIIPRDFHQQCDRALKRANYKYYPELMEWKELQDKVCSEPSALIIFSTTQNARDFYYQLKVATDKPVLHLSSKMYLLDRKQVLIKVRRFLAENKDFYLIATQVVEAGIDLDFPSVFRQLAPIPSIIQAQGRLNREGKRDPSNSWLHIFNLAEGNILPEDIKGAAISKSLLMQDRDLNELNDIYYRRYLTATTDTGEEIEALRYQQKYDQVAEKFNIIENQNTVLVLAEEFLREYQYKSLTPSDWQILRSYTVNTRSDNYIEWINGILCWNGGYDECGIVI